MHQKYYKKEDVVNAYDIFFVTLSYPQETYIIANAYSANIIMY